MSGTLKGCLILRKAQSYFKASIDLRGLFQNPHFMDEVRDAYRDIGTRATQEAKAELHGRIHALLKEAS